MEENIGQIETPIARLIICREYFRKLFLNQEGTVALVNANDTTSWRRIANRIFCS